MSRHFSYVSGIQEQHLIDYLKNHIAQKQTNGSALSDAWFYRKGKITDIIGRRQKVPLYLAKDMAAKLGITIEEFLGPPEYLIPRRKEECPTNSIVPVELVGMDNEYPCLTDACFEFIIKLTHQITTFSQYLETGTIHSSDGTTTETTFHPEWWLPTPEQRVALGHSAVPLRHIESIDDIGRIIFRTPPVHRVDTLFALLSEFLLPDDAYALGQKLCRWARTPASIPLEEKKPAE